MPSCPAGSPVSIDSSINSQGWPGLSAVAVTTAALGAPLRPPIVHETFVVELYPTLGWTGAWQLPSALAVAASVMGEVMIDVPFAGRNPPRFLSDAETTQGEPHPEVSTDSTV